MTLQFRSWRADLSRGGWHDVLPGVTFEAPSQGWRGIEFREKPEDAARVAAAQDQLDSALEISAAIVANDCKAFEARFPKPDPNPACICDGGVSGMHGADCPT